MTCLTDYSVVRRILIALWEIHNLGGTSSTRVYRNRLLEAVCFLFPADDLGEKITLDECLRHVEKREREERRSRTKQLTFATPQFLERLDLAFLLLLAVKEICVGDEKEFGIAALIEKDFVNSAVFLLQPIGGLPKSYVFETDDLLKEAQARRRSFVGHIVAMDTCPIGLLE